MSGTPFSGGQLSKLRSHIDVGVATALPKVADKFGDPKRVLKAFNGRGEEFAGHLEVALESAIKSMLVLIPHQPRTLAISKQRDPDTYYRTRSGLWVGDGYRTLIVPNAKPVEVSAVFNLNEDELRESLTDAQIEKGLSRNHLFDESAMSAIVAELIESGKLGKDNWYLLYTTSCVVGVGWGAGNREWGVRAWGRGGGRWSAGGRVLSPAN